MKVGTLTSMFHEIRDVRDKGMTLIYSDSEETFIPYDELYSSALRMLLVLQNKGIQPGDEVVFQVDESKGFVFLFWACIIGGMIPVPVVVGNNEEHGLKLINIIKILNNPYIAFTNKTYENFEKYTNDTALDIFDLIKDKVLLVDEFILGEETRNVFTPEPDDIAFIQFSSGSTGKPKGVILSHENLHTNIVDIIISADVRPDDSMLSWMPLSHDLGLIVGHIVPAIARLNQFNMSTNTFIYNPSLWLEKASEHKATYLSSPNFGYKHFLSFFQHSSSLEWDLSHVKAIYNGAEPILPNICNEFLEAIKHTGINKNVIAACYGLAEGTVSVASMRPFEEMTQHYLERNSINLGSKIVEVSKDVPHICFVDVGAPLDHCQIRICDDSNHQIEDRRIGHIQIKGKSVTQGYYNNDSETEELFTEDGWLITGDLGFMDQGRLTVTGRYKDLIIINGQNYYPHDIERIVTELDGIEFGHVVACAALNEKTAQDDVLIFVYFQEDVNSFIPLCKSIQEHISARADLSAAHIIPINKIPKTSSGKIQRYILSNNYILGEYDETITLINELKEETEDYIAPEGTVEQELAYLWTEVLRVERVSRDSQFFALGGNSLKAKMLCSRIERDMKMKVSIRDIFLFPKLISMAERLVNNGKSEYALIPLAPEQEWYPVTSVQRRMIALYEWDKTSISYNLPYLFELTGELDVTRLENAWKKVVARHESLRTSFAWVGEELKQRIHSDAEIEMLYEEAAEAEAMDIVSAWTQPFKLDQAPLCRVGLICLEEQRHFMFFDAHHIVSDGTSMGILIKELIAVYEEKDLDEIRVQYKDYAVWKQEQQSQIDTMNAHRDYWLEVFKGDIPVLDMPTDYVRPSTRSFEGNRIQFGMDAELSQRIRDLAVRSDSTVYMVLFAAYNILLSKYTGQADIVVGTVTAGRTNADVEQAVGMFVNTLPLRLHPEREKTFNQFLIETKEHFLQANEHQDYEFEQLVNSLVTRHDQSRNPLFDMMFVLQNMEIPELKLGNAIGKSYELTNKISKFDMTWEIQEEVAGSIRCDVEYCTALYNRETIERMVDHYTQILESVIREQSIRLGDINILTPSERELLIHGFNQTGSISHEMTTLHQLFEEQADKQPDELAVVDADNRLTYRQLNERANQLAGILRSNGVASGVIVALLLDRSVNSIVSILAVLKAGGTYLPIDPDYPLERIEYILNDSQSSYLITTANYMNYTSFKGMKLNITTELEVMKDSKELFNLECINSSQDAAYIIYTSGTTGVPKGVVVEHRNVIGLLKNDQMLFDFNNKDVWAMFHSYCFDFSVWEMYGALLYGGKLVVVPKHVAQSPAKFACLLKEEKVTVLNQTPTAFYAFIQDEANFVKQDLSLRYVIFGGETLNFSKLYNWKQHYPDTKLINMYGITETTVVSTYKEITEYDFESNKSNIGRPIHTTTSYILNAHQELVHIGGIGELYIGGHGVARGYLNRDDLTQKRFVTIPSISNERVYRSGDLARWLPDGTMEYMGRIDDQVKIRGYRIECGEIELQLLKQTAVKEAVVLARETQEGDKCLCAYVVAEPGVDVAILRKHLEKKLPSYMIPSYFMLVDRVPLTANGKVDQKSLPLPQEQGWMRGNEYVPPQGELEERLVEVWESVLGINPIGRRDNFFELGGDSIKAIQISARLQQFGLEMDIRDLFQNPSIEQVVRFLKSPTKAIDQGIIKGEVELSPIQQRFFRRQTEHRHHFNQSVMLYRKKRFQEEVVQQVMLRIMEHHDALRMAYEQKGAEVYQFNKDTSSMSIELQVWNARGEKLAEIEEKAARLQASIELEKGPLVRLGLFQADDGDHLLIVIHHLIVDAVSWRILLEDFSTGYTQALKGEEIRFQAKTSSYQEWSKKMKAYANSVEFGEEKSYWQQYSEHVKEIMPEIIIEEVGRVSEGRQIDIETDEAMTEKLFSQVNRAYNTETNEILVTALSLAIHEWNGSTQVCIDLEGHGRDEIVEGVDVTRTLGWFSSIYPVLLRVEEPDLGKQIKVIKETLRAIPNQGIGYGIYRYLTKEGLASEELLPKVSFSYFGQFDHDLRTEIFESSPLSAGGMSSPDLDRGSALEIIGFVKEGKMRFSFGYNEKKYHKTTIENLAEKYKEKLQDIINHCVLKDHAELTPSDVMIPDMTIKDIEDIYAQVAAALEEK